MAISTNCSLVENLDGFQYPKMNNVHVIIKNPAYDTDSAKRCQNENNIGPPKNETKIENRNVNAIVLDSGIQLAGGVIQH